MITIKRFRRAVGFSAALCVGFALTAVTPALAAPYKYQEIPQKQMSAVATDSVEKVGEGANGPINLILDGNKDTYWHTKWQGGVDRLPHWFIVDLGKKIDNLGRIDLLPRQSSNGSGRVGEYQVWALAADTCNNETFERGGGARCYR